MNLIQSDHVCTINIYWVYFLSASEVTSHLLWQSDDRSLLCEGGDPVGEVVAAGSEH